MHSSNASHTYHYYFSANPQCAEQLLWLGLFVVIVVVLVVAISVCYLNNFFSVRYSLLQTPLPMMPSNFVDMKPSNEKYMIIFQQSSARKKVEKYVLNL